ncbi:hypothetical protein RB597_010098 [Gaeumannomyces tritici]
MASSPSYEFYSRLVATFEADESGLLGRVSLLHSTVGMIQYVYYIHLTHADGRGPLPLWIHLFHLAHDSVFAWVLATEAPRHGNHAYFTSMSKGLAVWSLLEVYCIYRAVVHEREGLFADKDDGDKKKGGSGSGNGNNRLDRTLAYVHCLLQLFTFYCLVLTVNYMVGPEAFPHWTLLAKVLACVGPGGLWLERGSRRGARMGLAVLSVVDAVTCFSPYSRWVLVWPEVFDNPVFYLTGVCCTMVALFNVYVLTRLPYV